jgi:hypothetical protein
MLKDNKMRLRHTACEIFVIVVSCTTNVNNYLHRGRYSPTGIECDVRETAFSFTFV